VGVTPARVDAARWRIDPLLIRSAVATDLPGLRDVFRRASLSNEGDRAFLHSRPELLDLSDEHVLAGRTHLAELGGSVVGFATIVLGDSAAELEDLFVDPDQWRQGIGRALVAGVVAAARQAGCSRVEVDANRHALAFYLEVGFVGAEPVVLEHGTAIRMGLDLHVPG